MHDQIRLRGLNGLRERFSVPQIGDPFVLQHVTLDEVLHWPWYRRIWHNMMATVGPLL